MTQFKFAFAGNMGVGKSTATNILIKEIGVKEISFAEPIYNIMRFMQRECNLVKKGEQYKDRYILQTVGDIGRNKDPNLWVDLALNRVVEGINYSLSDLRFENEFNILKSQGWILVKIVRDKIADDCLGTGSATHISEVGLNNISDDKWDYIIENNSTVEIFEKRLIDMLHEVMKV